MSHCETELLDHYCKLMSLESANVNHKPCLPSALLGSRRYLPYIRKRTVFSHKFYSQMARREWNLIKSYLSIPRVSFLVAFSENSSYFTITLQKKFWFLQSFPAVNWVQALPAERISMLYHLGAAVSPPKAAFCAQCCHGQPSLPLAVATKSHVSLGTSISFWGFVRGYVQTDFFLEEFCWIIKCQNGLKYTKLYIIEPTVLDHPYQLQKSQGRCIHLSIRVWLLPPGKFCTFKNQGKSSETHSHPCPGQLLRKCFMMEIYPSQKRLVAKPFCPQKLWHSQGGKRYRHVKCLSLASVKTKRNEESIIVNQSRTRAYY